MIETELPEMNEPRPKIDYLRDPNFKRLQFEIRNAFELGWRAAGGDETRSPPSEPSQGWRDAWLKSSSRAFLVSVGVITGEDGWR